MDTLHTAYSFTYDQIGQLRHARTLEGFDGFLWNATTTNKFSASYTYDPVGNIRTLKRFDKDGNLLDDLTYHYTLHNNKLSHIADAISTTFSHDLETQPIGNYQYDPVGNLISDASRNLTVQYTYSNRPKFINFANRILKMRYNPFGYRFFSGQSNRNGDLFIYSSQGQLVAKYSIRGNELKLDYMPIYEGSKRIGVMEPEDVVWQYCPNFVGCPMDDIGVDAWGVVGLYVKRSFLEPERKYELVDHLGNVRVVIADQRVPVSEDGTTIAYYKPKVLNISDYYPYGWVKFHMDYSFGANAGSLFENWDSARGTYYTLYRLLDSRIARWYQVEPKVESYGTWSGYSYVFNNPVKSVDMLGLDTFVYEKDKNGKWILKKVISSDDPIEGSEYRPTLANERQLFARFIVGDDSGNVIKDEVVAMKRIISVGGDERIVRFMPRHVLVKGSLYELVDILVDTMNLPDAGLLEPSYIDVDIFMGIGSLLRGFGAMLGFHGSKQAARTLLKVGDEIDKFLKPAVYYLAFLEGDWLSLGTGSAGDLIAKYYREFLKKAQLNEVIVLSAKEYMMIKMSIIEEATRLAIDRVQQRNSGNSVNNLQQNNSPNVTVPVE